MPGRRGTRTWVRAGGAMVLHYLGAPALLRLTRHRGRGLVLMYHRVLEAAEVGPDVHPGMYVTRSAFARQLEYLVRHYRVVTPAEFAAWLDGRARFLRPPCLITFDDGWRDNYEHAFPLLKARGLPAIVFLVTGEVGQPCMLTWTQVHEMAAAGLVFGSHTVSHAALPSLAGEEVRRELTESRAALLEATDGTSDWFCYPKGAYTESVRRIAKGIYGAAVTTRRGLVAQGDDRWSLKRIGIHDDVSFTLPLFSCRLSLTW